MQAAAGQTATGADAGAIGRSPALDESLERAHRLALAQGHAAVTLEHMLFALTDDVEATSILAASQVSLEKLRTDLSAYIGRLSVTMPAQDGGAPRPGADLLRILQLAALAARQSQRRSIDGAIVLAAIIGDGNSPAAGLLKAHGLTFEEVIRVLQTGSVPREAAMAAPPAARAATPPVAPMAEAAKPAERTDGRPPVEPPPAAGGDAAAMPEAAPAVAAVTSDDALARARARVKLAEPPTLPVRTVPLEPPSGAATVATSPMASDRPQPPSGPAAPPPAPTVDAALQAARPVAEVTAKPSGPDSAAHDHAPPPSTVQPPPPPREPAPPLSELRRAQPPPAPQSPQGLGGSARPAAPPHGQPSHPERTAGPGAAAPAGLRPPGPAVARPGPSGHGPSAPPGAGGRQVPASGGMSPPSGPPAMMPPAPKPGPPAVPTAGPRPQMAPPALAPGYAPAPGPSTHAPAGPPPMHRPQHAPAFEAPLSREAAPMPPLLPAEAVNVVDAAAGLPAIVRIGTPVLVEIRLPRSQADVPRPAMRGAPGSSAEPAIVRAVAARLQAAAGSGLFIEPRTPETVWLDGSPGGKGQSDVVWQYVLTPQRKGMAAVTLTIAGRTLSPFGSVVDPVTATETFAVTVKRRRGTALRAVVRILGLAGLGAAAAWSLTGPLAQPLATAVKLIWR